MVIFAILYSVSVGVGDNVTWKDIQEKVERLNQSDERAIWVDIIDTSIHMYAAGAFMTIEVPFEKAAATLMDFDNYDSIFRYVSKIEGLGERGGEFNKHPRYYAEGKAAFIHAWGLGEIDSLEYTPNDQLLLHVRPVKKSLQRVYLKRLQGKIKYTIRDIHINGYLVKIDDNHCRLGVLGWSRMKKKIPRWILTIIMKLVLPQFVADLEDYALKREKPRSHLERDAK